MGIRLSQSGRIMTALMVAIVACAVVAFAITSNDAPHGSKKSLETITMFVSGNAALGRALEPGWRDTYNCRRGECGAHSTFHENLRGKVINHPFFKPLLAGYENDPETVNIYTWGDGNGAFTVEIIVTFPPGILGHRPVIKHQYGNRWS